MFYLFSAKSAQLITKKPSPVITGGNINLGPDIPTKIIATPRMINKNAEMVKTVLFSIVFRVSWQYIELYGGLKLNALNLEYSTLFMETSKT